MRVLFDQSTPVPLKHHLPGHQIQVAFERGWSRLTNGELLVTAESRFDVLVTADRNLRYQQSLAGRKLAILVLPTTSWPQLIAHTQAIAASLAEMKPGEYRELSF